AIRAGDDRQWVQNGNAKLLGRSIRSDTADPVPRFLGEPEVAVRARGDGARLAVSVGQTELGDGASRRIEAADGAEAALGEPEPAVGPGDDPGRLAIGGEWELRHSARCGDVPDSALRFLAEPDGPVGAYGQRRRNVLVGQREFRHLPDGVDVRDPI